MNHFETNQRLVDLNPLCACVFDMAMWSSATVSCIYIIMLILPSELIILVVGVIIGLIGLFLGPLLNLFRDICYPGSDCEEKIYKCPSVTGHTHRE